MDPQQPIDQQQMEKCAQLVAKANRVVFFTGAGMSAESGIGTFRGGGGLWSGLLGYAVMGYFGTPMGWKMTPGVTWSMYIKRFYTEIAHARPNPGHYALAQLQTEVFGDKLSIVTQNVDGLHQRAGNAEDSVFEVHGTVRRHRCLAHGHIYTPPTQSAESSVTDAAAAAVVDDGLLIDLPTTSPKCQVEGCSSTLRPDAVLFGESLPENQWSSSVGAVQKLRSDDVLIIVGTSAKVYPAAGLPELASRRNAQLIEVNLEPTSFSELKNYNFLKGPSGVILPQLVERVKEIRNGNQPNNAQQQQQLHLSSNNSEYANVL